MNRQCVPSGSPVSGPDSDSLARWYRSVLALVALLVLANQALVQPSLMQLMTDVPLINVAGRQRMLSQRLAKAALALAHHGGGEGGATHLRELREVRTLWYASHDRIRRGEAGASRGGRGNSEAIRDGLDRLEPSFSRMRDAADRLIADGGRSESTTEDLAVILGNEAEYLREMERIVSLCEAEARGRVIRLRSIGWGMAAATIAALAAIGRFILRPAVGLIREQVSESARARDELEARVLERTRDLEAARERHRELLEQLGQAGRASTIGEMATGLAHELNQPLGAIANYAEGCLIELESPRPALVEVRAALERLLATTMRAGRIIDRVRRFVTRQDPHREPVDVDRVAREAIEILGGEAQRRGVLLRLDLAPGLPCPSGDPVQILQVLVNLIRNAFESLGASQVAAGEVVLWTRRSESGGVELGVSDNGEGISPERLERIFDSYFSTRADGMGMGLAICRTIAEAHRARIRVESEPGSRTTFRITFPVADDDDDAGPDGLHRGR